jgi:hypothetical protein
MPAGLGPAHPLLPFFPRLLDAPVVRLFGSHGSVFRCERTPALLGRVLVRDSGVRLLDWSL